MSIQENNQKDKDLNEMKEISPINLPINMPTQPEEISNSLRVSVQAEIEKNENADLDDKEQDQTEEEAEMQEEEEITNNVELGNFNQPLCPIHKIDAQNFCLEEDCPFALNCVLCVNDHSKLNHSFEKNNHLSLTFNKNLADQLFNKSEFDKEVYKKKINEMILPIRFEYSKKCSEFEKMLFERLEDVSHEFMIMKVREFLDLTREKYENNRKDFNSLKEFCSTFNDFLTLKKSEDIPKADEEMNTYKSYLEQFERTQELNFKYFEKKIKNIEDQPSFAYSKAQPIETETIKNNFNEVVNLNNINVNKLLTSEETKYVSNKLYKKSLNNSSKNNRYNETINVENGVASGPRQIKKRRVSIHDLDRVGPQRSRSSNVRTRDFNNISAPLPQNPQIQKSLLKEADIKFLADNVLLKKASIRLIYKGSRDGLSSERFHSLCDNKGPTLSILKSKRRQEVFGGFAEYAWSPSLNDANSDLVPQKSCLFSLSNNKVFRLNNKNNDNALKYHSSKGPLFGLSKFKDGEKVVYKFDLNVVFKENNSNNHFSSSFLGSTYGDRKMVKSTDLSLENHFELEEIEVYLVTFQTS